MSARSRQAWRLAYLLQQQAGVPVELVYLGTGRDRAYSGWHVRWSDGPTVDTMRRLATGLAGQAPAVDISDLRYDRGTSDLAETAALLRYLDTHPDQAPYVTSWSFSQAHATTEYPERCDPVWLDWAQALMSLNPHSIAAWEIDRQLRERANRGGWEAVLAWLDGILAVERNPDVIHLTQARACQANGVLR